VTGPPRTPAASGAEGAAPHTTLSAAHPRHSIESVMDHFRYCIDLVGIDHVAFGPDTLYGDHVQLHQTFAHLLSLDAARGPAFEPVACVDGMENPTENFMNICGWLVRMASATTRYAPSSGETSTGPCRPSGSAPDRPGAGRGAAAPAIPGLSDKDLTVKV
jgi:Membrane dipeptidase (Peptidase family M19)